MVLKSTNADLYVPGGGDFEAAFARTTHLGIGAHQDDLEFMAYHGIAACYQQDAAWFSGVICTDGGGSARTGPYANHTDKDLAAVRREEQREAARVGRYAAIVQLNYRSSAIKGGGAQDLAMDLETLLQAARPDIVYTHNPADKHDTHIAVLVPVLRALRLLPASVRPKKVYGCEVWRGLDWMLDDDKTVLDVSAEPELASKLTRVFDSQIMGGKRYDLATLGRWEANATYLDAHTADEASRVALAMDLTPLVMDENLDVVEYVLGYVERFRADVRSKLERRLEQS